METIENPFWNRKRITDARYFVGREAEIRTIFRAIKTGQSLSIVGPRRIGKSSLLTYVCNGAVRAKYPKHILVYINCQELIGEVTRADIYQKLGEELEKADPNHVHSYEPSKVTTFLLLQERVKEITNDGKSIVFLLDEFESLASNKALDADFFSQLRALSETQSVVYLTASAQTLYDLSYHDDSIVGSPFFNTFSLLRLGLMGSHEAQSLIMALLQMVPSIKFDEDDLQLIHHCAGTHPFFIQIVSELLFDAKVENSSGEELSTQAIVLNWNRRTILQIITRHFNKDDLKTLSFHLGENYEYESIEGEGKKGKARGLVEQIERNAHQSELINEFKNFPAKWPIIYPQLIPKSNATSNDDLLKRKFLEQAESHFQYIWRQLSSSLRETIHLICKNGAENLSSDLVETLEEKCLLIGGKIFSEVFTKFVIRQKENQPKEEQSNSRTTELEISAPLKPTMQILGDLTPVQRLIARQIFAGQAIESATFTELAGGYANFGIYRVEAKPVGQPRALRSQVLKFASAKDIRRENENFANLVKDRLGIAAWHSATYWFPPDFAQLPQEEWHHEVAAVLYPFAQTSGEATVTFEHLYQQPGPLDSSAHEAQLRTVYKMLLDSLDKWQTFIQPQQPLPSLRDAYKRLGSKRDEVQRHTLDLPELGLARLSAGDVGYLQRAEKVIWRGEEYTNPIYWVQQHFGAAEEPAWLKTLTGSCYKGLVHGDLNYRNILVEQYEGQAKGIWLIDFADTHEGHVLRDYGTLEAELKFILTHVDEQDFSGGLPPMIELEKEFLLKPGFRDELDLEGMALPKRCRQQKLERMTSYIRLLRGRAKEKYMPTSDVRPYYLSLLHATFPIVYYSQLNPWQRLYAFLSAALICDKIDQLPEPKTSGHPHV